MTKLQGKHTCWFKIGAVPVALTTPVRSLRRQYRDLYRHWCVDQPPDDTDAVRVTVLPKPWSFRHRQRYDVMLGDEVLFEPARRDEILPYVDWAINWQIPYRMPQYLQLHASALSINGEGLILPGKSGSGKSTLAAGLLTSGFKYLSDEFAMLHTDTLEMHPYPRAVCVKKPSHAAIASVGLSIHRRRYYHKKAKGYVGFVDPFSVGDDVISPPVPIRHVIFPTYTPGTEPTLIPISRAEAAFDLQHVCFNLLRCKGIGLSTLAGMIRQAACYRLIAGELAPTCALVAQAVQGNVATQAMTA